jgi:hypothetical protein
MFSFRSPSPLLPFFFSPPFVFHSPFPSFGSPSPHLRFPPFISPLPFLPFSFPLLSFLFFVPSIHILILLSFSFHSSFSLLSPIFHSPFPPPFALILLSYSLRSYSPFPCSSFSFFPSHSSHPLLAFSFLGSFILFPFILLSPPFGPYIILSNSLNSRPSPSNILSQHLLITATQNIFFL